MIPKNGRFPAETGGLESLHKRLIILKNTQKAQGTRLTNGQTSLQIEFIDWASRWLDLCQCYGLNGAHTESNNELDSDFEEDEEEDWRDRRSKVKWQISAGPVVVVSVVHLVAW